MTAEPDRLTTSVGLPISDHGTGMWAVQGILAALYEQQRTGVGRLVVCSRSRLLSNSPCGPVRAGSPTNQEPTWQGSRHRHNAPYQRMRAKDGYLMIRAI